MKKTLLTLAGIAAFTASANAASTIIFAENFDELNNGGLIGQGGFVSTGTNATVTTDSGQFGFSGKIATIGTSGKPDAQLKNSITVMNDTDLVTMSFDLRIDGTKTYTYIIFNQSGFSLGVEYGNFAVRGADGGTQNFAHGLTGAGIYHLTMTIDPTAFSGAGSANATFAQYTAENTLGTALTYFEDLKLDLNTTNKKLSNNTDITFRLAGYTGIAEADNLLITQVPEPSSTALLGLGGLALIFRRRK